MYFQLLFSSSLGIVVLVLLMFSTLQWFHIPVGNVLDWVIGGASFWWLIVIVTVPWNVYFQAKEVLTEGVQSAEKGMFTEETRKEIARIAATLLELRATNQTEHERLAREARSAISQLSTDGQFLDHVREIIRFFKTA